MSKKSQYRAIEEQLLNDLKAILTTQITADEEQVIASAVADLERKMAKNLDTSHIPNNILHALTLSAMKGELSKSIRPLYSAISQGKYVTKGFHHNIFSPIASIFQSFR
jgi:hypothetical protein